MTRLIVAAVQTGSKLFDTPATLKLFAEKLQAAKALGADLAVFPEAFIGGYPKGIDFGVRVGMRSPEGREQFKAYFDGAISRDSSELKQICKTVKKAGINTVLGIIEKDGGTLYCSSVCIGRNGEILSWHRKLMPTAMERVIQLLFGPTHPGFEEQMAEAHARLAEAAATEAAQGEADAPSSAE